MKGRRPGNPASSCAQSSRVQRRRESPSFKGVYLKEHIFYPERRSGRIRRRPRQFEMNKSKESGEPNEGRATRDFLQILRRGIFEIRLCQNLLFAEFILRSDFAQRGGTETFVADAWFRRVKLNGKAFGDFSPTTPLEMQLVSACVRAGKAESSFAPQRRPLKMAVLQQTLSKRSAACSRLFGGSNVAASAEELPDFTSRFEL